MQGDKNDASALVRSVIQGESDNALYWTCMCLRGKKHGQLEDAWIEISARIGAKQVMPFKETWISVNSALFQLIKTDELHICDAVQMTGMLFLLYHRQTSSTGGGAEHFSKLRKEILEYFPEGAMLSSRGQQQFARIIPPLGAHSHLFVHRVLAGLGRLVEKEDIVNVHRALEYISRKKLQIPMPNVWPAPSLELADKGDPVWFLWGAMMCMFPQNTHVSILWELYNHQWRHCVKTNRAGLLWGIAHMMQDGVGYVWQKEERAILEKSREIAPELWASINDVEGNDNDEEPYGKDEGTNTQGRRSLTNGQDGLDIMNEFVPRASKNAYADPVPMHNPAPRIIHIQHGIRGATADERSIIKTRDQNNRSTENNSRSRDEAGSFDPRYRWLNFGTERK